jgi:hypothetical protein
MKITKTDAKKIWDFVKKNRWANRKIVVDIMEGVKCEVKFRAFISDTEFEIDVDSYTYKLPPTIQKAS